MPTSQITIASGLELATAAHDLRNRLSIAGLEIRQMRSAMPTSSADAAVVQDLLSAERAVAEASSRMEALLELTRLHIRVPDSGPRATDLVTLARKLVEHRQRGGGPDRLVLLTTVPRLLGPWNSARIRLALCHLLNNAVQYSSAESRVLLCMDRQGSAAMLSIVDRGIGIPE